jgi:hypothetical protein
MQPKKGPRRNKQIFTHFNILKRNLINVYTL